MFLSAFVRRRSGFGFEQGPFFRSLSLDKKRKGQEKIGQEKKGTKKRFGSFSKKAKKKALIHLRKAKRKWWFYSRKNKDKVKRVNPLSNIATKVFDPFQESNKESLFRESIRRPPGQRTLPPGRHFWNPCGKSKKKPRSRRKTYHAGLSRVFRIRGPQNPLRPKKPAFLSGYTGKKGPWGFFAHKK